MFPDLFTDDVFALETARLWLRWPRAADAPAVTAFSAFKAVAEMTARVPHPYPEGAAEAHIIEIRRANAAGKFFSVVMTLKDGPRTVIGRTGLGPRDEGGLTLGYMLHPDHWGLGYASEAVEAVVGAAFILCGAQEVHADVRVINAASRRVLEKAGFTFLGRRFHKGPARDEPHEVDFSVLTRSVWEGRRGLRSLGRGAAAEGGAPCPARS